MTPELLGSRAGAALSGRGREGKRKGMEASKTSLTIHLVATRETHGWN
jgi:hypothetical protein